MSCQLAPIRFLLGNSDERLQKADMPVSLILTPCEAATVVLLIYRQSEVLAKATDALEPCPSPRKATCSGCTGSLCTPPPQVALNRQPMRSGIQTPLLAAPPEAPVASNSSHPRHEAALRSPYWPPSLPHLPAPPAARVSWNLPK